MMMMIKSVGIEVHYDDPENYDDDDPQSVGM